MSSEVCLKVDKTHSHRKCNGGFSRQNKPHVKHITELIADMQWVSGWYYSV